MSNRKNRINEFLYIYKPLLNITYKYSRLEKTTEQKVEVGKVGLVDLLNETGRKKLDSKLMFIKKTK